MVILQETGAIVEKQHVGHNDTSEKAYYFIKEKYFLCIFATIWL